MTTSTQFTPSLISGFLAGLKPIPILTVSQWAADNRILTTESSSEPGPWRNSRTPYMVAIMDDLSPLSPVQEVVFQKGTQISATEAALNALGCHIDISPAPIMYVGPTIDVVKKWSKTRLQPLIDNCPNLSAKIRPTRERDSGNTILSKSYPGGILIMAGGNSAASLRSQPVKVLILDEIDSYPLDLDGEGDPISIAEKRTDTFGSTKKIYKLSTPTVEGTSAIAREMESTDYRKYHIPCPHCKHLQILEFEYLRWEHNKPETAHYICTGCGEKIEERSKTWMLDPANGAQWIPTKPENIRPDKKGYFMPSLYSPYGWLSWARVAEQFIKAGKDVNKLKTFFNTVLAETWKDVGEAPEWENIYNRREDYPRNKPTNEVAFITAGADVQKDRIEVELVGWCKNKRSYSLDYRVLTGDTAGTAVWDELAKVITETFVREDGAIMPIRMTAIDTGYNTHTVYDFCRRFDQNRVIPVKGDDNHQLILGRPTKVDINQNGKKTGTTSLWHVGVSFIKSELYGYLRQNLTQGPDTPTGQPTFTAPHGFCHFPQYGPDYFKGLTAEKLQIKIVRGKSKYEWKKTFDRNEPLDCRVYARAAAAKIGYDRMEDEHFDNLSKSYPKNKINEEKQQSPTSKKPGFLDSRKSIW